MYTFTLSILKIVPNLDDETNLDKKTINKPN
jgi:hypothetical protein